MNSLKEIWESLTERFKNPLLYSFCLSWSIINYKFIVVITSDSTFSEKIDYIDLVLYPASAHQSWKILYLPLISAATYVFVLPIISLLTTWTGAIYERWHSNIRAREAKLGILTKDQRQRLETEAADLNNKLRVEAQNHKDLKDALDSRITNAIKKMNSLTLRGIFLRLKEVAPTWADTVVRKPVERDIPGGDEYKDFVESYGIPQTWARVFEEIHEPRHISVSDLSNRFKITDSDALEILLGLAALNMLQPSWIDGDLRFELIESSWVALLNGRPA